MTSTVVSASPIDDAAKRELRIRSLMGLLVALSTVIAAIRAYFSGQPWMVFFEDDFYYYLKIAQNIAHGSGSTFSNVVSTNGYHPLWLLALTGLSFFTTRGWVIFWFVAFVALIATIATFFLSNKMLEHARVSPLLKTSFAGYIAIYALHLFYTGMEIILAIPLMFLVIIVVLNRAYWQRGLWQAFSLGLLISLMILARLDLALFAGMLACFALLAPEVRRTLTPKQLFGIVLGLCPVALYLLFNHAYFGTWLPISGMAKQLKFTHIPSWKPWASVYGRNINNWINLLPIHLAIVCLPIVWKRLQPMLRVVLPAVLLFPFVYIFLLSCLSDWQLWLWYLYPMRAALCASFIIFSLLPPVAKIMRTPLFTVAVALIVVVEVSLSKWWTDVQPPIYAAATEIQAFAQTHPGTYAMGDRSGMVGYLLPDKLIQTEGLVMDRTYLDRIKRQDPLLPTLRAYGVRYYVTTAWDPYTGCFHAAEPFQAGKTSAHLKGDLCSAPLLTTQHERYRTMIFDLSSNTR